MTRRRHPLTWVPSSYFAMGTVYVAITSASNIMFKNLGLANEDAALCASLLGLPYVLKPLGAPLIELFRTKRFFVIGAQVALTAALAGVGLALRLPVWLVPVLALLGVAAVAGATMDVASDGVYVTTLGPTDQARFTGFQSVCWSLGPILVSGALVALTGVLEGSMGYPSAWMFAFLGLAGLLGALALHHALVLPPGAQAAEHPDSVRAVARGFGRAFSSFFAKKGIVAMLAFAFFYRFALGMLDKIEPLFMLDGRAHGGLGLSNLELGNLQGGLGSIAFMAGSLLGGWFVARRGLKRVLLILCISLNAPVLGAIYLSWTQPASLTLIASLVFVERLGWGFGAVGHMLYMMQQIAPGPYQTAHYAFGTGLMGLCMMLTGMVSGILQQALGYPSYFAVALVATIPSIAATLTAPFHVTSSAGPAGQDANGGSLQGAVTG